MTLRRFPWKVPRKTDNSFRLFVSAPSPGTPPADSDSLRKASESKARASSSAPDDQRRQSTPSSGTTNQGDESASSKSSHHHHHSHHHREKTGTSESSTASAPTEVKQENIRGPWRLLRLLPRESRSIIGRMLDVNPKKRATIEEMLQDPWVSESPVCQQVDHGQVIKATGHVHTLVPAKPVESPAPGKK